MRDMIEKMRATAKNYEATIAEIHAMRQAMREAIETVDRALERVERRAAQREGRDRDTGLPDEPK